MQIPDQLPGLKWLTIGWGLYSVVWITLEGSVPGVVLIGGWSTAVILGRAGQRWLAGRQVSRAGWLVMTAVAGLLFGIGCGVLTLLGMVIKTGLHAHGPEFSPAQIEWVWAQLPLWTAVGLLTGLGVGLVSLGLARGHGRDLGGD